MRKRNFHHLDALVALGDEDRVNSYRTDQPSDVQLQISYDEFGSQKRLEDVVDVGKLDEKAELAKHEIGSELTPRDPNSLGLLLVRFEERGLSYKGSLLVVEGIYVLHETQRVLGLLKVKPVK